MTTWIKGTLIISTSLRLILEMFIPFSAIKSSPHPSPLPHGAREYVRTLQWMGMFIAGIRLITKAQEAATETRDNR
jgi:hypothetical protein